MVDDAIKDIERAFLTLDEAYDAVLQVQEELDQAILDRDSSKVEVARKELLEWWGEISYYEKEIEEDINSFMKERIEHQQSYSRTTRKFIPIYRPE